MRALLLFLLVCSSQLAFAQKFSIKGQITDEKGGHLPAATVLLMQAKDSTLVNFASPDGQGAFELKNITKGEYLVKVTFVGFTSAYKKTPPAPENNLLDLGTITLQPVSNNLKEVLVKGEVSPVTVKKDTIEYNAGSFKTQPNAAVEDLLKKLPGVLVENDGTVMVKGEKVQRVTVDGKEFFGRDPKIATKNLPADAVDKVQVFDKKSDQAMFSGIDDGQKEKTINLQLKEEKRNSAFGNATGGVGTDERFMAKANLNRFQKGKQLSFLGMSNNINTQGFGIDEYLGFSGGMQQMASGRGVRIMIGGDNSNGIPLNNGGRMNGMSRTFAGGVNFNQNFGKKTEANGSYFLNNLNQDISRQVQREHFLPSGQTYLSNQNGLQQSQNMNHRANFSLDQKIDTLNSIKLTGSVSYNETSFDENGSSEAYNPSGRLQNQSNRTVFSDGFNINGNANVLYRHRFNKAGRTFSANTTLAISQGQTEGESDAENFFYAPNGNKLTQLVQQRFDQETENQSYGTTFSFTESLGNRRYLEANYSVRQNQNQVSREVFNMLNEANELDPRLSNKYNSQYFYNRAGINLRVVRKQFNAIVGTNYQQTSLKGRLVLLDQDIKPTNFRNLLPIARLNYDFTSNKHAELNYETSMQEPTIQQLQPVTDNSDPLNIYQGNANLQPAYLHNWRLNYNMFNPVNFMNFFAMANVNYTTNAITNAQWIDENLVRTTQPVNVKDNTSINGFGSFGFPINKINSRFNIGTNLRYTTGINLLNDVATRINQHALGGNARYEFRYKELLDFSLRGSYTLQKSVLEQNENQNQLFYNKSLGSEANYNFPKSFSLNTTFDYQIYNNPDQDFHQRIPLLNLAVSKYFLKAKSGELKLSVQNLLDKNLGINQTANANYIERETLNSLGRYYMVSFTYAINKHLNPMGTRPGGRMIRMTN